jgi:hypothetical protein
MKKNNVLKYASSDKDIPGILPIKLNVPEWYKNTPGLQEVNNKNMKKIPGNFTFKSCSPFLDALTSGYSIPLPMDIAIEQTDHGPSITWGDDSKILDLRNQEDNLLLPVPQGHSDLHFVWRVQHFIKIPKGYSAIFTHPLNRFDLPFTTLSGIVDGEFALYGGNVPVFFSSSFEGVIPEGTPIMQIIPFKTENWVSEKDLNIIEEGERNHKISSRKAFGWYKQNIWKKKTYN